LVRIGYNTNTVAEDYMFTKQPTRGRLHYGQPITGTERKMCSLSIITPQ